MKQKLLFALLLVMEILSSAAAKAQMTSGDGSTIVTNSDGTIAVFISPEEHIWSSVQRLLDTGKITNALDVCNKELATNPTQRWAKLARMQVWGELGETAKAEQDFNDLTRLYPNFLQVYSDRAIMLLKQPVLTNGTPPLVDWLNSPDEHKRTAAKNLIERTVKIMTDHKIDFLNSTDKGKQRMALECLQLAWKLDQGVVEHIQVNKPADQPQDPEH
jgi:tetratricopeptide (TPR) repeat protein